MVVVSLAAAVICFTGTCHPALVGNNTPSGTYVLSQKLIDDPGYGGDILVYKESDRYLWAIHRVYTLKPEERRTERLRSGDPAARRAVTHGCINVMPEVYRRLVDCCSKDMLVIN